MLCHEHTIAFRFPCRAIWKILGLICLILSGCGGLGETEVVIPIQTNTENPVISNIRVEYYGVVYPYSADGWNENERPAIRERLEYLRSLEINTVIQVFSSEMIETGTQQNWLIFLDEAQRVGIQVIARLYPSNEGVGKEFNFQDVDEFLAVVQGHPALLAYLGLHEPLEQFDSEQLQKFYRHIKAVAPSVNVAHYMDNMAWFDVNPRFPHRRFTTEICDICIIWYYPATFNNEPPILDLEYLQGVVRDNRMLVNERSPNSELWFLGQAHSQQINKVRMPTPKEMESIFNAAAQEDVNGFLWYAWLHDQYDDVLGDPYMESQREIIRTIYTAYQSQSP